MSTAAHGAVVVDELPPAPESEAPERGPRAWVKRLAEGELGSLRVLIVLALIWTYFAVANSNFLTSANLTNLALQIAPIGTVSVGVVLDAAAGRDRPVGRRGERPVRGDHGRALRQARLGRLRGDRGGARRRRAIGLFQGTIVTWLAIPSFVVTLAGLLGWQGAQLAVLGETGTVNITDTKITNLAEQLPGRLAGVDGRDRPHRGARRLDAGDAPAAGRGGARARAVLEPRHPPGRGRDRAAHRRRGGEQRPRRAGRAGHPRRDS